VQGVVCCPGLIFVTREGRTIYDLRGAEHEDVNHRGESGQSANPRPLAQQRLHRQSLRGPHPRSPAPRDERRRGQRLSATATAYPVARCGVSSLIKSYRAKSHKVVPVKLLHIVISRQANREKGNASWYAGSTSKGLSSPINAAAVNPWTGRWISRLPFSGRHFNWWVGESKVTSNVWSPRSLPTL
jgi:hypothetical protein